MKLRVEISDGAEDEIIIRCKKMTEEIIFLQELVCNATDKNAEFVLHGNNTDYYVNRNDILFFETSDGKTTAHTSDRMYYTDFKLFELEKLLPGSFIRASKSCILNSDAVSSVSRNITGASEVRFKDSIKKVYVSRMYFKMFDEKMKETRLSK